jgi:hypothetical protein
MVLLQAAPMGATGGMSGIIMIILLCLVLSLFRSTRRSTLVLKKFVLSPSFEEGNIVEIVGRKSGLFSWVLTIIGIYPESRLIVSRKELLFSYESLFGKSTILTTLKGGIAHVRCDYSKPLLTFIFAIFILIASIAGSIAASTAGIFIIGLVVSVILFLIYHFNKSIAILVETRGGTTYGLKFKPDLNES